MTVAFRAQAGRAIAAALAFGWMLVSGGCEQVIGTKHRTLNPQVTADAACTSYCSTIMQNCTGANSQYVSLPVCLADCSHMPQVLTDAMSGNSVQCRQAYADSAKNAGEPAEDCYIAGPMGGDQCGLACDAYCTMIAPICPMAFDGFASCSAYCSKLTNNKHGYNTSAEYQRGDTLQCRIFHLSAATQTPLSHCPHAGDAQDNHYCNNIDAGVEQGSTCTIEDGADDCDRCEGTQCCSEKNDCYNDVICDTADAVLDSCKDLAESADAGTNVCHSQFVATNANAAALENCLRRHCATECELPPLAP